ncbi:TPA: hypothetical protein ACXLGK_005644 [Klebsiella pneumoniae]
MQHTKAEVTGGILRQCFLQKFQPHFPVINHRVIPREIKQFFNIFGGPLLQAHIVL